MSRVVKRFSKKIFKSVSIIEIFYTFFKKTPKKPRKLKIKRKILFFSKNYCKIEKSVILYVNVWMNTTYTLSYTAFISFIIVKRRN